MTAVSTGAISPHGTEPDVGTDGIVANDGTLIPASELTVARNWHPWRWVTSIATLVVVAQFAHGLATNPGWNWGTFSEYFTARSVMLALWLTIQLTFWGTLIGFGLGVVLAAARLSRNPVLQVISWSYVWAFRSIPLIVQLLFWFNIGYLYQTLAVGVPFGPAFFEFNVNSVINGSTAAVIGLALHQAAYSAEIIRAGIISVDEGQTEAAAALGIPRRREFFKIILPQAMRSILPNATNEVISLFKGTSIVSVMAIAELFYQVQIIYGRSGRVVPMLMVATVWYVVFTSLLSIVQFYVERHYHSSSTKETKIVATFSGAGDKLQGEIAALTKKDNGLIEAVQKAINHAIENGTYQKALDHWGLGGEAVKSSVINPPGLPKTS